MFIATAALSVFLAAGFLYFGFLKVAGRPQAVEIAEHLGLTNRLTQIIGVLEISAAVGLSVGLAWAPLGAAAAVGLILLLIGATIAHRRVNDPASALAPPITLAVLAAATLVLRLATS
jgi:DoxX-like family